MVIIWRLFNMTNSNLYHRNKEIHRSVICIFPLFISYNLFKTVSIGFYNVFIPVKAFFRCPL